MSMDNGLTLNFPADDEQQLPDSETPVTDDDINDDPDFDEGYEDQEYQTTDQEEEDRLINSHPSIVPNDQEDISVGDTTIRSAKAEDVIYLLDNLVSHTSRGPRFRWTFFMKKVEEGAFKETSVIIPLDYDRNGNNARRYLGRRGLKLNQDFSILRQPMPTGEVFILLSFT